MARFSRLGASFPSCRFPSLSRQFRGQAGVTATEWLLVFVLDPTGVDSACQSPVTNVWWHCFAATGASSLLRQFMSRDVSCTIVCCTVTLL